MLFYVWITLFAVSVYFKCYQLKNETMTQKEKVLQRINKVGYVDNYWAIKNYILRLGALMFRLKKEIEFEGKSGLELNKPRRLHKNYYYVLK